MCKSYSARILVFGLIAFYLGYLTTYLQFRQDIHILPNDTNSGERGLNPAQTPVEKFGVSTNVAIYRVPLWWKYKYNEDYCAPDAGVIPGGSMSTDYFLKWLETDYFLKWLKISDEFHNMQSCLEDARLIDDDIALKMESLNPESALFNEMVETVRVTRLNLLKNINGEIKEYIEQSEQIRDRIIRDRTFENVISSLKY